MISVGKKKERRKALKWWFYRARKLNYPNRACLVLIGNAEHLILQYVFTLETPRIQQNILKLQENGHHFRTLSFSFSFSSFSIHSSWHSFFMFGKFFLAFFGLSLRRRRLLKTWVAFVAPANQAKKPTTLITPRSTLLLVNFANGSSLVNVLMRLAKAEMKQVHPLFVIAFNLHRY